MLNILVTGSSGFLGSRLTQVLTGFEGVTLSVALRFNPSSCPYIAHHIEDIAPKTDWSAALASQQVVIHAAARAHVMKDLMADPLAEYRKVNVEGTLNLARQAADSGVKRFIFISSIGVNGNTNTAPFTAEEVPSPTEFYAQSKWEAEQGLQKIAHNTGLDVVVIRPPLVYGPGAPGNFGSLVNWIEKGIPLPLGAIHNKRSLIALDNLVDLIVTCIHHPAAANQVFLAADGEDISTSDLLRGVARAMGRPARLLPIPASLLQFGATLLGKKAMAQRLLGSLQVDITKAREVLGWQPPLTVEQGLARCFETETEK